MGNRAGSDGGGNGRLAPETPQEAPWQWFRLPEDQKKYPWRTGGTTAN